ncbi:MAG: energy transducer TonB [Pseudomonadota bacterium]
MTRSAAISRRSRFALNALAWPLAALLLSACAAPAPTASADEWRPTVPNPKAPYPLGSRENGEQGEVLLQVLTNAEGKPTRVEVKKSSGYARLDKSAVDTVRLWQFKPLPQDGTVTWREVPIRFFISGPLSSTPAPSL